MYADPLTKLQRHTRADKNNPRYLAPPGRELAYACSFEPDPVSLWFVLSYVEGSSVDIEGLTPTVQGGG